MARTATFSARWDEAVVRRLKRRSEAAGTTKSRLAERYVDEGTRMDEHPGIVFQDGPSGRRAALVAGPDIWQVMATLRTSELEGEEAVNEAAELLNLPAGQIRAAIRYYTAYPDDIDERLRRHFGGADADEAAWRREQAATA